MPSGTYILFQGDEGDLIVSVPRGPGYYVPEHGAGLFAADAWKLSEGARTELGRGHKDWAGLNPDAWVEAEWSPESGFLDVVDAPPQGSFLGRYLGVEYDSGRWELLDADAFRAALLAASSGSQGWRCAVDALTHATGSQLEALTPADLQCLLEHPWSQLRMVAIQRAAVLVPRPRETRGLAASPAGRAY